MTRRAGKSKRKSPGETTATSGSQTTIATGKTVVAEVVKQSPEYTFVGSGRDAALICQAIKSGWNISVEARQRVAKKIEAEASKEDLTLKDIDRLATLIHRCDRSTQEAIKLDMFAQLNGLESEVVEKTNAVKPEEKLVEAMLERCETLEQARWLLDAARTISN
jgi:hypothetical protein